jgi:tetratricopeptide (TPR) repeat protein
MITLADGLDARGDFDRAERVLKRVLEVRAQNGNLDDADANRTIDHLDNLYTSDKRYKEAEEMVERMINNPALSQATNPSAYANNLERLAVIHFKNKEVEKALSELTQVVALKKAQRGEQSPELAIAYEELGDTYRAQGQNADARSYFMMAHAIYDHAVVNKVRTDKMDYSVYYGHVKQLDEKLR